MTLWDEFVEKPCVCCGTLTSTNIMSSRPMCAGCHHFVHWEKMLFVERSTRIRDWRRIAVACLGLRPPWWRPLARSRWMAQRRVVNANWTKCAIDILPSASRLPPKWHAAFMGELRGMEQIGSELPPAWLHVGARG